MTDADLDELLSVPPGEFIATRRELVRRLKADGERDRAERVGKIRRPPITAWALDQVARDHPDVIADLLAVGARLRAATSDALQGDASELRAVRVDERGAIDAVVRRGLDAVATTGQQTGTALQQRIIATVRAALGDDELGQLLARGHLLDEYEPSGFGFSTADMDAKIRAPRPGAKSTSKSMSKTAPKLRSVPPLEPAGPSPRQLERADRLRTKADQLRHAADELETRATAAEAEAERLRRQAEAAVRSAERAETAATEAARF